VRFVVGKGERLFFFCGGEREITVRELWGREEKGEAGKRKK